MEASELMAEARAIIAQPFDWLSPDYVPVFASRQNTLRRLRADPKLFEALKVYYASHPWDFINDWGMTFDPRNVRRGLPAEIPFVMFPRQFEFVRWLYDRWKAGEYGVCVKSRDCGASWLVVAFDVTMWLFVPGFMAGLGSRKDELVDRAGDDKSLFEKARLFLDSLPVDFLPPRYDRKTWRSHKRIVNPDTKAAIIGESGDNIGRGGRTSIYQVDEKAYVERQDLVDSALSGNTDCQIDLSSVFGSGNAFYRSAMQYENTEQRFTFHWRQDPRKTQAWYDGMVERYRDRPWLIAQEYDLDFNAANQDVFIPGHWVAAAVDAHIKLNFDPSGIKVTGFDPADVGDARALTMRWGSVVLEAKQKTDGDIAQALPWAYAEATNFGSNVLRFDADGMGAPVMKVSFIARTSGNMSILAYNGSGSVEDPDAIYGVESLAPLDTADMRTNRNAFQNYRAQTWTWVYHRFQRTFEAVQRANAGHLVNYDPDTLISISSRCEALPQLQAELSRPKRKWLPNGKIAVESKIEMRERQVDSTNLADSLIIAMSTRKVPAKPSFLGEDRATYADRGVGF